MTDTTAPGAEDQVVGVDVGGTGVKAALVDMQSGVAAGRVRIPTPQPATPEAIADVIRKLLANFGTAGPIGCTLPAVISRGVVRTAAHIDESWIGAPAADAISAVTGRRTVVLNDADAAGIAEARYGAARDHDGLVILVTVGTGVGTAVLNRGALVPNSELGHLQLKKRVADTWASDSARTRDNLPWKSWSQRLDEYVTQLHKLLWPDLILIGGGIVKHADKFMPRLDPPCEVRVAELGNLAGIVGAAVAATETGPVPPPREA